MRGCLRILKLPQLKTWLSSHLIVAQLSSSCLGEPNTLENITTSWQYTHFEVHAMVHKARYKLQVWKDQATFLSKHSCVDANKICPNAAQALVGVSAEFWAENGVL